MDKKIKNVLIELGITPNLKGFNCIVEAVGYIMKNNDAKTTDVYEHVANTLGYKAANVERTIRHCILKVDENSESWRRYIGIKRANNSTFLFVLAMKMEED